MSFPHFSFQIAVKSWHVHHFANVLTAITWTNRCLHVWTFQSSLTPRELCVILDWKNIYHNKCWTDSLRLHALFEPAIIFCTSNLSLFVSFAILMRPIKWPKQLCNHHGKNCFWCQKIWPQYTCSQEVKLAGCQQYALAQRCYLYFSF